MDLQYFGGWLPHGVQLTGIPPAADRDGNAQLLVDWGEEEQVVTVVYSQLRAPGVECPPDVDPPVLDCSTSGNSTVTATTMNQDTRTLPPNFPVELSYARGDGRVMTSTPLAMSWLRSLWLPSDRIDCSLVGADKQHPASGNVVDLCHTVGGATGALTDDGIGLVRAGQPGGPARVSAHVLSARTAPDGANPVTIEPDGQITGIDGEPVNADVLATNERTLLQGLC
jgi:hypothetical protein